MNWITKLFRNRSKVSSGNGAVVYLDVDILSKEDIDRIKQRMTPVFIEFSSFRARKLESDVHQAVVQAA